MAVQMEESHKRTDVILRGSYPALGEPLDRVGRTSSIPTSWMHRWWPSSRLRIDPLQDLIIEGRYRPTTVANFKLIPSMRARLLANRNSVPLTFTNDLRLTVVIPIRNREAHLRELVPKLRETLTAQRLNFRILAVEQDEHGLFNKGKLLNVGMQYAAAETDYYCLHDVDMIPLEANYLAPSQPFRLVNELETTWRGSSVFDPHYFAGAISVRKHQVFAANGFSNEYWGWGKEDDDFHFRLLLAGFVCYFDMRGRYHDLPNPAEQRVQKKQLRKPSFLRENRARKSLLLRGLSDPAGDGLSTLSYLKVHEETNDLYSRLRVRL